MCTKTSYLNAFDTVDFTEETVYFIYFYDNLRQLRADKSPGVDGIYPVVLKSLANFI